MISHATLENLRGMRCSAMATAFQQQLDDPKTYGQLGFEERFCLIVDAEWNRRQANKLNKLIRDSAFSENTASIEAIEYLPDRKLDKSQILRFATCKYIDDGHHIILSGASGSGKTYVACALGNAACRKFRKVRYIRLPELLEELNVAKGMGTFKKVIAAYRKVGRKRQIASSLTFLGGCFTATYI